MESRDKRIEAEGPMINIETLRIVIDCAYKCGRDAMSEELLYALRDSPFRAEVLKILARDRYEEKPCRKSQ
jgi:hypothetical protein